MQPVLTPRDRLVSKQQLETLTRTPNSFLVNRFDVNITDR